jgi:flagellin-like protein
MQLKQLFTDDDAVSPVIGVILMVAITVILAAVIGTFVLGIGSGQEKAPQVSFDYSNTSATGNYSVEMTHASGDNIDPGNIELRGTAMDANLGLASNSSAIETAPPEPWTAGNTINISQDTASNGLVDQDSTAIGGKKLNMVWINPQGGDTKIISDYTFPTS